jgi:hypothetical protein
MSGAAADAGGGGKYLLKSIPFSAALTAAIPFGAFKAAFAAYIDYPVFFCHAFVFLPVILEAVPHNALQLLILL